MRKILEVLSQREKAVLHQEVNFRGVQLAPASDLGLQILFFLWGQGRMLATKERVTHKVKGMPVVSGDPQEDLMVSPHLKTEE